MLNHLTRSRSLRALMLIACVVIAAFAQPASAGAATSGLAGRQTNRQMHASGPEPHSMHNDDQAGSSDQRDGENADHARNAGCGARARPHPERQSRVDDAGASQDDARPVHGHDVRYAHHQHGQAPSLTLRPTN